MITYVARRVGWTAVVLFAITVVTFLMFFAIPGIDPSAAMAGRNPSPATIRAINQAFGLNQPLPVQYVKMMQQLFGGNLVSYTNPGERVLPLLLAAAPVTLSVVLGASVFWIIGSVAMGMATIVFPAKIVDQILSLISIIAISTPVFWLGEMAQLTTQNWLHRTPLFRWVPPPGYVSFFTSPVQWFEHLLIPWLVLAFGFIGLYSRVLRASLLQVRNEEHVTAARAKGLAERPLLMRHVLRLSLIPFVSLFGLDLGALIGGGVILVEVVFGLPGVGFVTFQALGGLDLPVIMATVIYGAFFIVVANLLVDVAYGWLDPRIRAT